MIFAGRLTERLQFYRIEETQGRSGYKSTNEVFKFEAYAERMKNKETITENADEVFHYTELSFRLRKRDIADTDIVVYEGNRYRIMSIDKYPRDNEMVIKIMLINE